MSFNEQLWAPWRLGYLQGEHPGPAAAPTLLRDGADPHCFLCLADAAADDPSRHVVRRGARVLTVLNRYPYNNGHLLVAPVRHCGQLKDLSPEEHLAISAEIVAMVDALGRIMNPAGFNIGLNLGEAAGAGLPGHLHWHIVPRWRGDVNFMPVLAGIKVIPQSLEALWQSLKAELATPG